MARVQFAALVLIALAAIPAQAWWCTGHMTIAQIAKSQMSSSAVNAVESVISQLSSMGPFPQIPSFVEAACWADDLKRDTAEMKNWHFQNIPYNPTNYPINFAPQQENVASMVMAMSTSVHWSKKDNNIWQLSFALGNLIHFYGDISQPLHVTEMFSAQFPNGDKGGNLFHINANGNEQVLHAYWDAICNQYTTDPKRPLSSSGRQQIESIANNLLNTYNFSSAQTGVWNSSVMAQESYAYAMKYAYQGIQPGGSITSQYFQICKVAAETRVALAGLRLANELDYLFGDSTPTADSVNERLLGLHEEYARHVFEKRMEHNARMEAMKKR